MRDFNIMLGFSKCNTVNFGYKRFRYKRFSLIRDYAKGLRVSNRTLRQSVIRECGYKKLIKLVPADLLYPKLTVVTASALNS